MRRGEFKERQSNCFASLIKSRLRFASAQDPTRNCTCDARHSEIGRLFDETNYEVPLTEGSPKGLRPAGYLIPADPALRRS